MCKIKFAIFDVGQVCYPFSLGPLNEFCMLNTSNKDDLKNKKGISSFNYKPFMSGKINFEQFCKDLCCYCNIVYSEEIKIKIDEKLHQGVGNFFEETLRVMNYLRDKNVVCCLLSNALPNLADTTRNLVADDKIFVSFELELLKPDVRIYEKVLKMLRAVPEEVLFVDDKAGNVEAAKSIGINGIVFRKNSIESDVKRFMAEAF
jgi:FMN phosphatase YigB (HAD superfamily)